MLDCAGRVLNVHAVTIPNEGAAPRIACGGPNYQNDATCEGEVEQTHPEDIGIARVARSYDGSVSKHNLRGYDRVNKQSCLSAEQPKTSVTGMTASTFSRFSNLFCIKSL